MILLQIKDSGIVGSELATFQEQRFRGVVHPRSTNRGRRCGRDPRRPPGEGREDAKRDSGRHCKPGNPCKPCIVRSGGFEWAGRVAGKCELETATPPRAEGSVLLLPVHWYGPSPDLLAFTRSSSLHVSAEIGRALTCVSTIKCRQARHDKVGNAKAASDATPWATPVDLLACSLILKEGSDHQDVACSYGSSCPRSACRSS